jgi:cytolysin-activating lysine-acyltransferase
MTDNTQSTIRKPPAGAPRTVAEALGQVVWLLSQSAAHKELRIKDLEWSMMPPILHEQFRLFSFGPTAGIEKLDHNAFQNTGFTKEGLQNMPLGVAVWAKVSESAEQKLEKGEHLTLEEWKSGERVWLVELISPFANAENKLLEVMLVDMIKGPFANTPFSVHRTDPATGVRNKVYMDAHLRAPTKDGTQSR